MRRREEEARVAEAKRREEERLRQLRQQEVDRITKVRRQFAERLKFAGVPNGSFLKVEMSRVFVLCRDRPH